MSVPLHGMHGIIAVASRKGGVGKTTITSGVAHAALLAGHKPVIVDADPERSLDDWLPEDSDSALREQIEIIAEADDMKLRRLIETTLRGRLVIVDTAGFGNRTAVEAMALADLVVMPVQPSKLDVAGTMRTTELIDKVNDARKQRRRPPVRSVCLLSRTGTNKLTDHFRSDLEDAGFTVLRTQIPNSVQFPNATLFGETPLSLKPKDKPAQALRDLWAEMADILATVTVPV